MPLVTWDQSYSVNIETCDAQHQKLFAIINRLHDAMKLGRGRFILAEIVRELENYTKIHFRAEEGLLRHAQYPRLHEHCLQHQKFVAQVRTFRENLVKGMSADSITVLAFLTDWLSKQIQQTDKGYAEYLNLHGIH